MNTSILWKEYRQQRAVWLAIAVLGLLLVVGLSEALVQGGVRRVSLDERLRPVLLMLTICLAMAYGVVCGALLLAGEKDDGTLAFLDIHSGWRGPIWQAKLCAGAFFTLAQVAVLSLLVLSFGLGDWSLMVILCGAALDALLYGLLGGAFCPTVFTAVLTGVVVLMGSWAASLLMPGPLPMLVKVGLGMGAIILAWRKFCETDRSRQTALALPKIQVSPGFMRVLLWLSFRQGRWVLAGCLVMTMAETLLLNLQPLLLYPLFTWGLGLACGLAVFAPEQLGEQQRFLGALRMPPGRFWLMKIAFWGLAVLVFNFCLWLGAVNLLILRESYNGNFTGIFEDWWHIWLKWSALNIFLDKYLFLTIWPVYGFAFGQFFAQLARRPILATILGGTCSAIFLALWIPSLVCGGLPRWQVWPIPLLLLLATRQAMWPWVSGRLYTWRPLTAMYLALGLAPIWLAGVLSYRAVEIPDVGEPFDIAAYEKELQVLKEREAGPLLIQAARRFQEHRTEVEKRLGPPSKKWLKVFKFADLVQNQPGEPKLSYFLLLDEVLDKGWPKWDEELSRYLDQVFEGDWVSQAHKVARMPLGLMYDPRYLTANSRLPELLTCQEMGILYKGRVMQQLVYGQSQKALEYLDTQLGLSRQIKNHAEWFSFSIGTGMENGAIWGWNCWLNQVGPQKSQLLQSLRILQKHQEETPEILDHYRSEFLYRENWELSWRLSESFSKEPAFVRILDVPWEKIRFIRLQKAVSQGVYQKAQIPYPQSEIIPEEQRNWDSCRVGLPLRKGIGSDISAKQWSYWLWHSLPGKVAYEYGSYAFPKTTITWQQLRVNAFQIVTALALYQAEKGHPPANLEALVPDYLPTIPLDPFTGKAFQYRVSQGEEITGLLVTDSWEQPKTTKLLPGQGLVWSEGDWQSGKRPEERRLFFPVPVWESRK